MNRREVLHGSAVVAAAWLAGTLLPSKAAAEGISAEQARAIAKEAYIYGFPLADNYRVQYSYFVDKNGPEFKAPWNTIFNNARVYSPDDKAIQTPNSDTPYSYVGADLRAEPLVFTVPAVEKGRYYSLQFIDMYTFNFAYVGSRPTGDEAGNYLLAGPNWKGKKPIGIKALIPCETEFAFVLYRTQLLSPDDIQNVKMIQAGYKVQSLSSFLGTPAPPRSPAVDFLRPLGAEKEKTSLEFFNELNFILQFCPTYPTEMELMKRFAKINVRAGSRFDPHALSPEMQEAVSGGIAEAWKEFADYKAAQLDTGKKTSADGFGTREHLHGDYLARMAAAVLGIYGNSKEEALYPAYFADADKHPLEGAYQYRLRFASGQLPPGECVLVADALQASGEPAFRKSTQPLSHQFADAT